MSEQFWIQGQDGKMEGSIPGVPKQGNGQEAAKQNRKLSPFLKQLRKNMENRRKSRAALVSDKNPTATGTAVNGEDGKAIRSMSGVSKKGNGSDVAEKNQRRSSFLDKLRKRMEEKRKNSVSLLVKKAYDIGIAEKKKMDVAYNKLVKAGLSTEGVDKYYHSVAHCKIARLGDKGESASQGLGLGKEVLDVLKQHFYTNPLGTPAKVKDSYEDLDANEIGRQAGLKGDPSKSCEELCKGQWPKSIPEEYKI